MANMTNITNIKSHNTITTHIFPCKSINLTRFIKSKGILSEHKYTDAEDNKDCWIFLRTPELEQALKEWHDTKPNTQNKVNI